MVEIYDFDLKKQLMVAQDNGGQWVRYSDYAALEAQLGELAAENERLRKALANLVQEMDDLVSESEGVAGLHLNGAVAEWDDLLLGGPYERLISLDDARRALEGSK